MLSALERPGTRPSEKKGSSRKMTDIGARQTERVAEDAPYDYMDGSLPADLLKYASSRSSMGLFDRVGARVCLNARLLVRMSGRSFVVAALTISGAATLAPTAAAVPAAPRTIALEAAVAATSGELSVETAPTKATSGNSVVTVRVANTGESPVRSITIHADGPPGVAAKVKPASFARLAGGSSVLATVSARGMPESRPALLVVRATGRSGAGRTAALASVELVAAEPAASLTLAGNTRLTDSSPADLVAVIANAADVPADVSVRGTAGQHDVRLALEGGDVARATPGAPLTMTVPARQSKVVLVQVRAHRPLRRGTTALVVTATVRTPHGATPVDVTASQAFDVALSADVLPGLLGVGSVLVIPGLVAVWAALTVLYRDRRRLGLTVPAAANQIWDNKLWLLAAVAVSLVGALLYSAAGFADLLDTYALSDVAVVTVVLGVLGAAVAGVMVWRHRQNVPVVAPISMPLEVLRAAARADGRVLRPAYRTPDGKLGLLVHSDNEAVVLTPQIQFTEVDISGLVDNDALGEAVAGIERANDAEHHVRFSPDSQYLAGPRAVVGATPSGSAREPILKYVDTF
jgi:hypothetical protein